MLLAFFTEQSKPFFLSVYLTVSEVSQNILEEQCILLCSSSLCPILNIYFVSRKRTRLGRIMYVRVCRET